MQNDVLEFWFSDRARKRWFDKNQDFDDDIRARFSPTVEAALDGGLADWVGTPDGAVALVIVLDQFPRNLYRGSPRAFMGDPRARQVASDSIARGFDASLTLEQRMFLYMPFQHSEHLADQTRSLELFTRWAQEHDESTRKAADEDVVYAQRHHDIIERFGRFPHRNAVLGRASTPEELTFLAGPNSSF